MAKVSTFYHFLQRACQTDLYKHFKQTLNSAIQRPHRNGSHQKKRMHSWLLIEQVGDGPSMWMDGCKVGWMLACNKIKNKNGQMSQSHLHEKPAAGAKTEGQILEAEAAEMKVVWILRPGDDSIGNWNFKLHQLLWEELKLWGLTCQLQMRHRLHPHDRGWRGWRGKQLRGDTGTIGEKMRFSSQHKMSSAA